MSPEGAQNAPERSLLPRSGAAHSERSAWLDLFAAQLERGKDPSAAARALGKSAAWGNTALADLRKRLGPQAV